MTLNSKKRSKMELALLLATAVVRVLLVSFVLFAWFILTVAVVNSIFREEEVSVD